MRIAHRPTMKPLRFCIVSTFYPPFNFGGDGIYAHRLANGLARRGHRVTVLHSPTAFELLSGNSVTAPYEDHENVSVHPIRTPLGALGLLAVQQTGRPSLQRSALQRRLRDEFDVIHYNNVSLLGGPDIFRYGRGLKLCTLIEHWLVCPMHVLWRMNREVCVKPTCIRCQLAGGRPPQLWRYTGLLNRASRHIDAFLGPSEFTIRMHQERGLRGTMIQLPLFYPETLRDPGSTNGIDQERPYFLFSGRLEEIKGVQILIPVFRRIPQVDLLIAGSGAFEPPLRALAADAPNIKFLGRVNEAHLHALYRGAVATVVPSICYETFGLIVAESFAASTPVIVHAQSSLEELVSKHGGGFKYRTSDELQDAIERLRTDAALRARLGREGRTAYESEFAEGAFIDHYLDVTRALLADRNAVRGASSLAGRRVFNA